jgi:CBS domain-containing protein
MILQGSSPLQLVREINQAQEVEQLYDLALRSPRIMHGLILEGAKPGNITRLITLINDHILDRLLNLLEASLGAPPVPYCWLYLGSEGRREQTFMTDQDNGIIYADSGDQAEAKACERYFKALGNEATRHLVNCGFPRCKGGIMASNPKWCQPLKVWKGYFEKWITQPEPKEVLNATIFFDFRPGYGAAELGGELRKYLMAIIKGQEVFLRFLAKDCLSTPPAIGMFKRFVLEREGEHKDKLDIKSKGLVPFVDFARLLSLRYQVPAANTLERLQGVAEGGHISTDLYQKAQQAYDIQMELRWPTRTGNGSRALSRIIFWTRRNSASWSAKT